MYDNFSMNRVFAVSFLASFLVFVAMFFFLLLTNSHAHAQGYDVSTRVTVASEIKERSTDRVSAKRKKPRHIVVMQARKADLDPPKDVPAEFHPSCKIAAWSSVTPDTVDQINAMLAQYKATKEQQRRLPTAANGVTAKVTFGGSFAHAYEGEGQEALNMLQEMLTRRLQMLTCKLRGLGVTVDSAKVIAPPT